MKTLQDYRNERDDTARVAFDVSFAWQHAYMVGDPNADELWRVASEAADVAKQASTRYWQECVKANRMEG